MVAITHITSGMCESYIFILHVRKIFFITCTLWILISVITGNQNCFSGNAVGDNHNFAMQIV
jgi:hypothetical protein